MSLEPNSPFTFLSWNIQTGTDNPLIGNGWSRRKAALSKALSSVHPDIFCVQEALIGQLRFLDYQLPDHRRVGVGRDDGAEKGEHCAIFYRRDRFEVKSSNTFWLSKTPERPSASGDIIFKRICTSAQFVDTKYGSQFSVFNTHFPLNPFAQNTAALLIIKKMKKHRFEGKLILTGDFNAKPDSTSWNLLQQSGLHNVEQLATSKQQELSKTQHAFGHPLWCIDAIFVSDGVIARNHRILNSSSNGVYPSDHFGSYIELQTN